MMRCQLDIDYFTINMAKANERTKNELNVMQEQKTIENDSFAVKKENKFPLRICCFCGRRHIFGRDKCPAYGKTCNKCKGKNHFLNMCKKK